VIDEEKYSPEGQKKENMAVFSNIRVGSANGNK
jgi:hypothetical protein